MSPIAGDSISRQALGAGEVHDCLTPSCGAAYRRLVESVGLHVLPIEPGDAFGSGARSEQTRHLMAG